MDGEGGGCTQSGLKFQTGLVGGFLFAFSPALSFFYRHYCLYFTDSYLSARLSYQASYMISTQHSEDRVSKIAGCCENQESVITWLMIRTGL